MNNLLIILYFSHPILNLIYSECTYSSELQLCNIKNSTKINWIENIMFSFEKLKLIYCHIVLFFEYNIKNLSIVKYGLVNISTFVSKNQNLIKSTMDYAVYGKCAVQRVCGHIAHRACWLYILQYEYNVYRVHTVSLV